MCKTNADIRKAAENAGIRLWQIADEMNINDSSFSRKLRHELSDEVKAQIHQIISRLSMERNTKGV